MEKLLLIFHTVLVEFFDRIVGMDSLLSDFQIHLHHLAHPALDSVKQLLIQIQVPFKRKIKSLID